MRSKLIAWLMLDTKQGAEREMVIELISLGVYLNEDISASYERYFREPDLFFTHSSYYIESYWAWQAAINGIYVLWATRPPYDLYLSHSKIGVEICSDMNGSLMAIGT